MRKRHNGYMRLLPLGATLLLMTAALMAAGPAGADSPQTSRLWQELHPKQYTGPKAAAADTDWHPDILAGYEARQINLGNSFDGPVRCTVIRKLTPSPCGRAVLIHPEQYQYQIQGNEQILSAPTSEDGAFSVKFSDTFTVE